MARLLSLRTLVLAALAAAAAYALKQRAQGAAPVAAAPAPPVPASPPVPAVVDRPAPPEADVVPEPFRDEEAEAEAAAAEAGAIGGRVSEADEPAPVFGVPADELDTGSVVAADEAASMAAPLDDGPSATAEAVAADPSPDDAPPPPPEPADQRSTAVWRNDDQPTVDIPAVDDKK